MKARSLSDHRPLLFAFVIALIGMGFLKLPTVRAEDSKLPAVGDKARDFELKSLGGKPVKLSQFTKKGPVVLMVLRGYPGYQCPICNRQVGQYITAAEKLKKADATVLMVYPGPSEKLKTRAEEFITGKTLPENFHLLIDPDYAFTNAWNLRWDAPRETAYPSTFVIDEKQKIRFAKISKTHGDRAPVDDVLKALSKLRPTKPSTKQDDSQSAAEILDRIRQHKFQPLEKGFTKDAQLDRHGIADLANEDWRVRTLAIRDLVGKGRSAVPAIITGLEDDNLHVRHLAALVLGILPIKEIPEANRSTRLQGLETRLMEDAEPVVRSEAAIALGRIGATSTVDVLKKAASNDASRDVRHQCALAVDRIEKDHTEHSLFEAYRSLEPSSFNSISVGKHAIDFTLLDTDGNPWKLSDFRGKKHVVLIWIFADWCPVCHGEFRDLVRMRDEFIDNDVAVATIECHEPYRTRVMVGKELLPKYWFAKQAPQAGYPGAMWWSHLSDPAGKVGAMYGVSPLAFAVHSEYINRPSSIIIDKEGFVRFAYYGTYWGDRPTIRQTLDMIRSGKFEFTHPDRLQEKS